MIVGYANRFKNVFFRLSCPNPSRQPLNHLIKNTKAEDSLRVENQVKQNPVGRGDDGAEGGTETGDTHLWRGCGLNPQPVFVLLSAGDGCLACSRPPALHHPRLRPPIVGPGNLSLLLRTAPGHHLAPPQLSQPPAQSTPNRRS